MSMIELDRAVIQRVVDNAIHAGKHQPVELRQAFDHTIDGRPIGRLGNFDRRLKQHVGSQLRKLLTQFTRLIERPGDKHRLAE